MLEGLGLAEEEVVGEPVTITFGLLLEVGRLVTIELAVDEGSGICVGSVTVVEDGSTLGSTVGEGLGVNSLVPGSTTWRLWEMAGVTEPAFATATTAAPPAVDKTAVATTALNTDCKDTCASFVREIS